MISANELRIGNWFIDAFAGKVQVEATDFEVWESINSTPIALTTDILEAAGFEGDDSKNEYTLSYKLTLKNRGDYETWYADCNMYNVPDLKYLHQLQNFFFAVTGTELEINL